MARFLFYKQATIYDKQWRTNQDANQMIHIGKHTVDHLMITLESVFLFNFFFMLRPPFPSTKILYIAVAASQVPI